MSVRPATWAEVSGQDIFGLVTSGSRGWAQHYSADGPSFIRVGNLNHNSIKLDLRDVQRVKPPAGAEGERTRLQANDLLVSITAEVGMIGVVPGDLGEAYINQHIALARPAPAVDHRFVAWYLASEADGKRGLREASRGGTKAGLGLDDIRQVRIPLAPRAEQQRISDKLDTVLARVDACRERLARVAPLLKRFRQSILAAATSGRLTETWRQETCSHPSALETSSIGLPSGWRQVSFAEVCTEITVGFVGSMASQYIEDGVPFLRSMNVRAFRFDPKGLQYISDAFHSQIKKSVLRAGDLAIVRSGAPGVCCVIPDELGEANCSDLVIARPGPQLVAAYGCIFMNSSFGASHVAANQVGVAQAHFNVGSMKKTPLPLPPVREQTEIVRRVDMLFALADRLEARLAQTQTAVDRLTPSLLAKAFRGELVPQDPADEPAAELLKRLAAQREATPARKRRERTVA